MATQRVRGQAQALVGFGSNAIGWCELWGEIPRPPEEILAGRERRRLRRRFRPVPKVLFACGAVLLAPLLLLAILDGIPASRKAWREDKWRAQARKRREATIAELGLDRTFDGDWNGTAGQLLLNWYHQAPDPERLLALHPSSRRLSLLAAPSWFWFKGRARKLQIVADFPGGQAGCEVATVDETHPYFRIRFPDGSWLGMRCKESGKAGSKFLTTCRTFGC
ncbi:hypothetical protein LRS74_00840 [Streptomyces sp. LX-29]|uniref:hypothetical protein n=1 Tax=Streptomyces sp. LX-29 TaxID=2900152 RepID=UPI00240D459A|nr:hypothetical protein [Streptomyces sp. LX-29]WFB05723.1 hypothetical protein LRS74_00840 [Streptomyces sp. LX-29]